MCFICTCKLVYKTFVYVKVGPMSGSKRAVAAPLLPRPVLRHIDINKCTCSYILKINKIEVEIEFEIEVDVEVEIEVE